MIILCMKLTEKLWLVYYLIYILLMEQENDKEKEDSVNIGL